MVALDVYLGRGRWRIIGNGELCRGIWRILTAVDVGSHREILFGNFAFSFFATCATDNERNRTLNCDI